MKADNLENVVKELEQEIHQLQRRMNENANELEREAGYIGTDSEDMELVRTLWLDRQILKEVRREKRRRLRDIDEQELPRHRILEQIDQQTRWTRYAPEGHELKHSTGNVFFVIDGQELYVMKIPKDYSQTGVKMFNQEIETAIDLDHPNIIKVVDYDLDIPYMVTEYYEGGTLAEADYHNWSEREKLTLDSLLNDAYSYIKKKGYRPTDRHTHNTFLKADGRTPVIGDLEGWEKVEPHATLNVGHSLPVSYEGQ